VAASLELSFWRSTLPAIVRHNAGVTHDLPEVAQEWLTSVLPGRRFVDSSWLTGGTDHANHAVTVSGPAGERRYVLRRWVRPEWREKDPEYTVAREQAALELLATVGADTPRLVAADHTGADAGEPALLMTFLTGAAPPSRLSDVESAVRALAVAADQIHAVDARGAGIPAYVPYHDLVSRETPADAGETNLWVRAMEYLAGVPQPTGDTFIHRDYHPYNVLWRESSVAVIDWSNASVGHPDQDVAHMRWNLAVSYGYEVAEAFRRAASPDFDRYWDVRVIVDLLDELPAGASIGADLPDLGGGFTPADRIAALERLLRAALS
jgi:aminoglycoside phosphotransferase (APT) family kinase protein